jgi:hypothetical protein
MLVQVLRRDLHPGKPRWVMETAMLDPNSFYGRLSASGGGDSPELIGCVKRSNQHILADSTDARRPGMLLGKIQSGKTRGFLGIIAHGFDKCFDIAIVLTKGTKALSGQTVARFKKDFAVGIAAIDGSRSACHTAQANHVGSESRTGSHQEPAIVV